MNVGDLLLRPVSWNARRRRGRAEFLDQRDTVYTERQRCNQSGARPVPGRSVGRGKGAHENANALRPACALRARGNTRVWWAARDGAAGEHGRVGQGNLGQGNGRGRIGGGPSVRSVNPPRRARILQSCSTEKSGFRWLSGGTLWGMKTDFVFLGFLCVQRGSVVHSPTGNSSVPD